MIPALKTSILADADIGGEFKDKVGILLSGVSIVCLSGKILGAAVTDQLGGWLVLCSVFVFWIVATLGSTFANSVELFGYAWLLNSFAYTITWGAAVQVVGATFDEAGRASNLALCASASRFGATIGNVLYGQLLSAGLKWRQVQMPMIPLQAILLTACLYMWSSSKPKNAPAAAKKAGGAEKAADTKPPSILGAFISLDFWLMLIPKTVTFTYTQFFMNYIPELFKVVYGFDDGMAATLGGVAQGGSVIGLLYVGNRVYKPMSKDKKVQLLTVLLALCTVTPYAISLGPSFLGKYGAVPLTVVWGVAYALPFYIPPGEFAMQIGGKSGTALFTNIFDAAGFTMSAVWNPWASGMAKTGDFRKILLSQALFGAMSVLTMPLCMYRLNRKAAAEPKKKQ